MTAGREADPSFMGAVSAWDRFCRAATPTEAVDDELLGADPPSGSRASSTSVAHSWPPRRCRGCGGEIFGVVYRLGHHATYCEVCFVAEYPPSTDREAACECCGRAVLIITPDRRERHVACSAECLRTLRTRSRSVVAETKDCVVCGRAFATKRGKDTCSDRCRKALSRQSETSGT
jgi:hypothetical protein